MIYNSTLICIGALGDLVVKPKVVDYKPNTTDIFQLSKKNRNPDLFPNRISMIFQ
jgi:hypothetical protein